MLALTMMSVWPVFTPSCIELRMARDLSDMVRRFSTEAFSSGPRASTVFDEHEAILKALEKHDPDEAEIASTRHLQAATEYVSHLHVARALGGERIAS